MQGVDRRAAVVILGIPGALAYYRNLWLPWDRTIYALPCFPPAVTLLTLVVHGQIAALIRKFLVSHSIHRFLLWTRHNRHVRPNAHASGESNSVVVFI